MLARDFMKPVKHRTPLFPRAGARRSERWPAPFAESHSNLRGCRIGRIILPHVPALVSWWYALCESEEETSGPLWTDQSVCRSVRADRVQDVMGVSNHG